MQVVDACAAPLPYARLDDGGLAVDHRAQDLDLLVAARSLDSMSGDVLVDVLAHARAGALHDGKQMELSAHGLPVATGQAAPQALGGVHDGSSTILPSLPPAVKRS